MSWQTLVRRRFEVVTAAIVAGLMFLVLVWGLMVLLKALNPYVFHFNLLMDILPWVTPVVIVLGLGCPLYWKLAGYLRPPDGGTRKLLEHRFQLVVGAFVYLMIYTVLVWAAMIVLRAWDVYDFHFNPLVDWLPAIVPPWLMWLLGSPIAWKAIGALGETGEPRRLQMSNGSAALTAGVVAAFLLSGGGLLLNQGVYAGAEQQSVLAQHSLVATGIVVFGAGALAWAVMLGYLWWGWKAVALPGSRARTLDRFRWERPRLLARAFVVINLGFGVCALLMTALQYMDPIDFHFYMALDIWSFGLPLFFGWLLYAVLAVAIPHRLAAVDPARWGAGIDGAVGPTGPAAPNWGYRAGDLAGSGPGS